MTEVAVAGEGFGAAPRRWLRPLGAVAEAFTAEADRCVLWLPVFFGSGIALYFVPTVEPLRWLGLASFAATALLVAALWRWPAWRAAAIALAFAAAGFAWMQQARWDHGAAMLERRIGPVAITGRVIDIDQLDRGWRVVIAP